MFRKHGTRYTHVGVCPSVITTSQYCLQLLLRTLSGGSPTFFDSGLMQTQGRASSARIIALAPVYFLSTSGIVMDPSSF